VIVIAEPVEMQRLALAWRTEGARIAVVPTMGALHEGHRSLIRIARARADRVVVTLFVNPAQFGPGEDFERYPRSFERDRAVCETDGADVLFAPSAAAMYTPDHSTWVEETVLSRGLCGARRPGHFRGVATVVVKLFMLTQPHVAVFGEKDAQQLRVIRRVVRDLNLPVEIIPGPTVREPDGLAMSSRNAYLSGEERRQAVALRRALDEAERRFAAGQRDVTALRTAIAETIRKLAPAATVDYIEIVDNDTLEPLTQVDRAALVAIAVRFPSARLIDNTVLRPEPVC